MAEPVCCPQCGGSERLLTARQAYEDRDGTLGGPPAWEVAPPPGPPPAESTNSTLGIVLIVLGGLLFLLGLYRSVAANPEIEQFSDAYQAGYRMSLIMLAVIPLTAGVLIQLKAVQAGRAGHPASDRWTQQMAVWEQARLCRDCRAAFWPDGVLRADIPASPLIRLEQFPLMVVTMAGRAHGNH